MELQPFLRRTRDATQPRFGAVSRVPGWVNRLATLVSVVLVVALVAQRCVEVLLLVRWGGWRYSKLGSLRSVTSGEAARTSAAASADAEKAGVKPMSSTWPRVDADAGTFNVPTPVKLLVPVESLQARLQKMKRSELHRRAES